MLSISGKNISMSAKLETHFIKQGFGNVEHRIIGAPGSDIRLSVCKQDIRGFDRVNGTVQ